MDEIKDIDQEKQIKTDIKESVSQTIYEVDLDEDSKVKNTSTTIKLAKKQILIIESSSFFKSKQFIYILSISVGCSIIIISLVLSATLSGKCASKRSNSAQQPATLLNVVKILLLIDWDIFRCFKRRQTHNEMRPILKVISFWINSSLIYLLVSIAVQKISLIDTPLATAIIFGSSIISFQVLRSIGNTWLSYLQFDSISQKKSSKKRNSRSEQYEIKSEKIEDVSSLDKSQFEGGSSDENYDYSNELPRKSKSSKREKEVDLTARTAVQESDRQENVDDNLIKPNKQINQSIAFLKAESKKNLQQIKKKKDKKRAKQNSKKMPKEKLKTLAQKNDDLNFSFNNIQEAKDFEEEKNHKTVSSMFTTKPLTDQEHNHGSYYDSKYAKNDLTLPTQFDQYLNDISYRLQLKTDDQLDTSQINSFMNRTNIWRQYPSRLNKVAKIDPKVEKSHELKALSVIVPFMLVILAGILMILFYLIYCFENFEQVKLWIILSNGFIVVQYCIIDSILILIYSLIYMKWRKNKNLIRLSGFILIRNGHESVVAQLNDSLAN